MSMNVWNGVGNLCRDVERRDTPGGMAVIEFAVAVSEWKRTESGSEEYPNYIDVTMFGDRAAKLAPILKKGMKVAVTGRLRQDRWKDRQTGQSRSKLYVIASNVDLMTRGAGENRAVPSTADDDLPF